jgi:hypothetical protein
MCHMIVWLELYSSIWGILNENSNYENAALS